MKRNREITCGEVSCNVSMISTRETSRGDIVTKEIRSGDVSRGETRSVDLHVSRHPYLSSQSIDFIMGIKSGDGLSRREITSGDVLSGREIRSGDNLSGRETRSGYDLSRREIRSGKVSQWDIKSCGNVSLKPLSRSTKKRQRDIDQLEVSRRGIRSGDDVLRNLSSGSMYLIKCSEGEIRRNDLETERRRDTIFSNLLLSRHHLFPDRNEHGIVVASSVSSLLFDDEGILCNILSRLPVRSLLRFKSVCKRWLSLIKHNRHFINLHFSRLQSRPNILFITPLQKQIYGGDGYWYQPSKTPRQCIFSADISSVEGSSSFDAEEKVPAEAIIRDVRMTTDDDGFVYDLVLKPVNGLLCFIDRKTDAVRIYNVSTREVTPWFKSTLLAEEKKRFEEVDDTIEIDRLRYPIYQFGFDPSTMEHKVFCFWILSRTQSFHGRDCESQSYASWEALTIGRDTKWRRIHVVPSKDNQVKLNEVLPPLDMGNCRVYVNGTIYWLRYSMNHGHWLRYPMNHEDSYDPEVIVAFDVGSEKFRVIPIPNFILDEPREESFFLPIAMLELNGCVALSYRMSPYLLKLWILDDRVGKKIENCHGNERNWRAETIKLPFRCDPSFVNFHTVVGTDQIVFECYDDVQKNLKLVSLYSYDCKKKTFKKIEIDGISLFPLHYSRSVFTTFSESLFSVA